LSYPDIKLLPMLSNIFNVSIDDLFDYGMKPEGKQMNKVKRHFEAEAQAFDDIIIKLIPNYAQMIDAMVSALPFERTQTIRVINLGCGTGTISEVVKQKFPNAHITCLDFSANMLEMAKVKLNAYSNIYYIKTDFYDYTFENNYDLVISSLT